MKTALFSTLPAVTSHLTKALLLSATLLGAIVAPIAPATAQTEEAKFYCGNSFNAKSNSKVPTTIVWTPNRKVALVQWVKPMGNYWTPQKRCAEFSQKIDAAYQNGTINYLTNTRIKGQKVICTAAEVNGDCKSILMTLRPQDNSLTMIGELKDLLNGRSEGGVITHSSSEPQVYLKVDIRSSIQSSQSAN
jgi:hypothetical protein